MNSAITHIPASILPVSAYPGAIPTLQSRPRTFARSKIGVTELTSPGKSVLSGRKVRLKFFLSAKKEKSVSSYELRTEYFLEPEELESLVLLRRR